MLRRGGAIAAALLGLVVGIRMAWGPLSGLRSPLNVESAFGLAVLIGLICGTRNTVSAADYTWTRRDAALLAIPGLIALLFWKSTHFGFLSDDFVLLKLSQGFAGNYRGVFTQGGGDGFFRPLTYISLAWTWPWARINPAAWHWVALGIHIINSLLVAILARWLGFPRGSAWFAGALFAIHASHPEAVIWMAGGFDLMATLFSLISLAAFVRAWESSRAVWWVVAMIAAALAMLSKESAYALPLMLAVFAGLQEASWTRRVRFVAPVTALAAVLFAYRWTRVGGIGGYLGAEGHPQMLSLSLTAVGKALAWRMWAILFFPINWSITPGWGMAAATVLYVAAWTGVLWWGRGSRRLLWLGLGFTLAAALPPVQQLLIGVDLEKSRLLYLPSVGFCLLAAAALGGAGTKLKTAAMVGILMFQAVALEHNLGAWEYASGKAEKVCEAVVSCSNFPTDVPRILRGVYFFANGLPECVVLRRGAGVSTHTCSLHWDASVDDLK